MFRPSGSISARPTKILQPLREILHGRQICVNLPARAVPFGSVAFLRRVFHTVLPVASPHSRQLGPTGCPFPLLSSRFSPVLSGGCGPSGAHAGQASHPALKPARVPPPTPKQTHWVQVLGPPTPLRGSRFAASASRHPSSPRYSGRVCMCIPLSVLPILLSVLQRVACQTDLARPRRC